MNKQKQFYIGTTLIIEESSSIRVFVIWLKINLDQKINETTIFEVWFDLSILKPTIFDLVSI